MANTRLVSSAEVQEFFFHAMIKGGANDGGGSALSVMPGYKAVVFAEGEFRLLDRWIKARGSNWSAGETTIWWRDVPVWTMHYYGPYTEASLPVVEAALSSAYGSKVFCGGRGLDGTKVNDMEYTNTPEKTSTFELFRGIERVRDLSYGENGGGFHHYSGVFLHP